MLVMLLGQSRVFYSMSRDRLLPAMGRRRYIRAFARRGFPRSCWWVALSRSFAAVVPIDILGELVSIGTLLAFVIVCAGVWTLRRSRPDLQRPFKTPSGAVVPILGMLVSFGLMAQLALEHMAAANRVADYWNGNLLRLRPKPQPLASAC